MTLVAILASAIILFAKFSLSEKSSREKIVVTPDIFGRVKLNGGYIGLSYDFSQVKMLKIGDDRIEVIDKKTGKLLDAYGEEIKSLDNGRSQYIVYREKENDFGILRLYTIFETQEENGNKEIGKVVGKYWDIMSRSGWYIENQHVVTISTTGNFPTTEIETGGTVTIVKNRVYRDINSLFLKKNYEFIRKNIDLRYRYSLY